MEVKLGSLNNLNVVSISLMLNIYITLAIIP